jgi:sulfur-oxidizing protein SoxX
MKHLFVLGVAASAFLASAAIAETAPDAVAFDGYAVNESLTGQPGDAAAGAKVMTSRGQGNCVACHVVGTMPDVPFQGNVGPALDGAADRWTEAELRGLLVNSKMAFDGTVMPAFYKTSGFIRPGDGYTGKAATDTFGPVLTAQQVEDVVAYLLTLKE